jgi:capsular exopolysaccharide synthesis family protein
VDHEALDLHDYLSILRARKWTIAVIAAVTTLGAGAYSLSRPPVYVSSAEVVVFPVDFLPSQGTIPLFNMATEVQIANSGRVEASALAELKRREVPPASMSASLVEGTETISFRAESRDPSAARATAQAYAEAYLDLRQSSILDALKGAREPYETQIAVIDAQLADIGEELATADEAGRAILTAEYTALLSERVAASAKLNDLTEPENVQGGRVLRAAELPAAPSSPDPVKDSLVGVVVGICLGMGLAFVRERLEEPVRGRGDLESRTGAPVLTFIPSAGWRQSSSGSDGLAPAAAEAFRTLRVRFLHLAGRDRLKTFVVTSSFSGEGKTSVSALLGRSLAEAGKRVVVVSADLRKPQLDTRFPPRRDGAGLAQVLKGKRSGRRTLAPSGVPNLWVLHAGRNVSSIDPSDLLGSTAMREVLDELGAFFDFVVIDSPPLTAPDVLSLAPLTDGVLLVVDARLAQQPAIDQARHELELVDAPILGVVVTKHDPSTIRAFGAGYGYYAEDQHPPPQPTSPLLDAGSGPGAVETPAERDLDDLQP